MRTWARFLNQVVPHRSVETRVNPPEIFARYAATIDEVRRDPRTDEVTLLTTAWRMFELENERRASIDSRGETLLNAVGIVVALIVGLSGALFTGTGATGATGRLPLAFGGAVGLIFLSVAAVNVLRIHGDVSRHTLGPDDLARPVGATTATSMPYPVYLAGRLLHYTTANYQVNNRQLETLYMAQRCLRNGLLALVAGGLWLLGASAV